MMTPNSSACKKSSSFAGKERPRLTALSTLAFARSWPLTSFSSSFSFSTRVASSFFRSLMASLSSFLRAASRRLKRVVSRSFSLSTLRFSLASYLAHVTSSKRSAASLALNASRAARDCSRSAFAPSCAARFLRMSSRRSSGELALARLKSSRVIASSASRASRSAPAGSGGLTPAWVLMQRWHKSWSHSRQPYKTVYQGKERLHEEHEYPSNGVR
mmetsp:Transcript_90837/g.181211  ORF Transcript_90837/g.181211 Transcript_90837/m.181211 type:complete len:216 (-) Transcript_90837:203-850(-)